MEIVDVNINADTNNIEDIIRGVERFRELNIDQLPPEEQEAALQAATMHTGQRLSHPRSDGMYHQRSGSYSPAEPAEPPSKRELRIQNRRDAPVQHQDELTPARQANQQERRGRMQEFYTGVTDTLGMLAGIAPSYTEESLQGRFPVFEARNGRAPSTRSEIEQALYMETVLTDTNAAKDVNRDRISAETDSATGILSHETGELKTRGENAGNVESALYRARQNADEQILQNDPALQSAGNLTKYNTEDPRSGALQSGWADDIFNQVVTEQFISLKAPAISRQITSFTDEGMQITEAMTRLDPHALKQAFYQIIGNMGWDDTTVTAAKVEAEEMSPEQIVNVIMGLASVDEKVITRYGQEVEARINVADGANAGLYKDIADTTLSGKQRNGNWAPSNTQDPARGVYLTGEELSESTSRIRNNFNQYFEGLPDEAPEGYERSQEDAFNLISNMLNQFTEQELYEAGTTPEALQRQRDQLGEYGYKDVHYIAGRSVGTRSQFVDVPNSNIDRLIEIQKRLDEIRSHQLDLWNQHSSNR